jgi:hypothetical protein
VAGWPADLREPSNPDAITGREPTRSSGPAAAPEPVRWSAPQTVDRRVGPHDFLATIYRHLGIDYERVMIPDHAGRPTPIVNNRQPIRELLATS